MGKSVTSCPSIHPFILTHSSVHSFTHPFIHPIRPSIHRWQALGGDGGCWFHSLVLLPPARPHATYEGEEERREEKMRSLKRLCPRGAGFRSLSSWFHHTARGPALVVGGSSVREEYWAAASLFFWPKVSVPTTSFNSIEWWWWWWWWWWSPAPAAIAEHCFLFSNRWNFFRCQTSSWIEHLVKFSLDEQASRWLMLFLLIRESMISLHAEKLNRFFYKMFCFGLLMKQILWELMKGLLLLFWHMENFVRSKLSSLLFTSSS